MRHIVKLPEQPLCRTCGAPIAKCTATIFPRKEPTQYDHRQTFIDYVYVGDAWPMTIDDCRRLTTQEVVGMRRHKDGRVSHFYTWDGESFSDRFFCSIGCGVALGRAAAKNELHLKPWRDAIERRTVEKMKREAREVTS
jgi:hypothetical protein